MEELKIHEDIKEKLNQFIEHKKVPNILFYGPSGSGKRHIVYEFINNIYKNESINRLDYIMFVDCAHGKGIKFIREECKFFAKTNINSNNGNLFKSIILSNADKLTIDAQSALRRCIELFSHTTRFFIIVEDREKLLKPILSRFSEIYIPLPDFNNNFINIYKYYNNFDSSKNFNVIKKLINIKCIDEISINSEVLYNKGISGLDLIEYIKKNFKNSLEKYKLLLTINKVKKEIKNEKFIINFIINLIFNYEKNLDNLLLS